MPGSSGLPFGMISACRSASCGDHCSPSRAWSRSRRRPCPTAGRRRATGTTRRSCRRPQCCPGRPSPGTSGGLRPCRAAWRPRPRACALAGQPAGRRRHEGVPGQYVGARRSAEAEEGIVAAADAAAIRADRPRTRRPGHDSGRWRCRPRRPGRGRDARRAARRDRAGEGERAARIVVDARQVVVEGGDVLDRAIAFRLRAVGGLGVADPAADRVDRREVPPRDVDLTLGPDGRVGVDEAGARRDDDRHRPVVGVVAARGVGQPAVRVSQCEITIALPLRVPSDRLPPVSFQTT